MSASPRRREPARGHQVLVALGSRTEGRARGRIYVVVAIDLDVRPANGVVDVLDMLFGGFGDDDFLDHARVLANNGFLTGGRHVDRALTKGVIVCC